MKALPFALLVLYAAATQAETYRWVEKINGVNVVMYSDTPHPGAEVVQLATRSSTAAPAAPVSNASSAAGEAAGRGGATLPAFRYERCAIASPSDEQSMLEVEGVTISASLTPIRRATDRVLFNYNGTLVPSDATSVRISPIYRGEHSVSVLVRDGSGATLCQSPAIRFYVQQPSVLRSRPPG